MGGRGSCGSGLFGQQSRGPPPPHAGESGDGGQSGGPEGPSATEAVSPKSPQRDDAGGLLYCRSNSPDQKGNH